jgi:GH15 family glucan-1,4-alpha-glucosidase
MSITTPVGHYGFLGDTRTAALVDPDGSLDWLCVPCFDGEPVFARLVGGAEGGCFRVGPAEPSRWVRRRYRPGSTTLETRWQVGGAQLVLTETMVSDVGGRLLPTLCLVRRLEAQGGPVRVSVHFDPRFGDERRRPRSRGQDGLLVCTDCSLALSLTTTPPMPLRAGQAASTEVAPGRPLTMALAGVDRGPLVHVDPEAGWAALLGDDATWQRWSAAIDFDGPLAPAVRRSLIVLRQLTYSPSGAPAAAPTTSLPEEPGGGRNWDYRYAWPRDASIGIAAFLGVGLEDEARRFLYWLLHASRRDRPRLPSLLTLYGRGVPPERELTWPGYADSRPVRIGNGAAGQHQLDNYGWVLDAMWLLVRAGHRLYGETWRAGAGFADFVAEHWREPDAGIWEVRGEPAHYVHSKLMGWLALDRALCIAETHRTADRRRRRWRAQRDAVAADVVAKGFDERRNTFVRAYGRRDVDAAVLLLPLLGLEPPGSARLAGTIDAVRRELSAGGPLLYRYRPGDDGLAGEEGAFIPCSFWLAQALAAIGRVGEAVELIDQLLGLAGPLGLFAEEADPASGEQLGNYPQALSHAALVQAALAVRDATRG